MIGYDHLRRAGNMHVYPVVPPVDVGSIITELANLILGKSGRQNLDISCLKDLHVVQNERFIQFDKFFDADPGRVPGEREVTLPSEVER